MACLGYNIFSFFIPHDGHSRQNYFQSTTKWELEDVPEFTRVSNIIKIHIGDPVVGRQVRLLCIWSTTVLWAEKAEDVGKRIENWHSNLTCQPHPPKHRL